MTMISHTETTELVSVDNTIDGIAQEALQEARRMEETQKCRQSTSQPAPAEKLSAPSANEDHPRRE
jgi:hypothetical protein